MLVMCNNIDGAIILTYGSDLVFSHDNNDACDDLYNTHTRHLNLRNLL